MSDKPAFDPSKPFEAVKPTFDPSQPFDLVPEAPISETESALRGAAQGATFGFAPALVGASEAAPEAIDALTGASNLEALLSKYRKSRDESKKKFDEAQKQNPKSYFAGNLAGAIAPALLTGGVSAEGAAAKGLSSLVGGALAPTTVAAGLTGAGYGALTGAGNATSSGEDLPTALQDIAGNAAGGAVTGGLVGKAVNAISNKLSPSALKDIASERALKATGMGKAQLKNLIKGDIKAGNYAASAGTEAPKSSINKLGQNLLEKNPYQETSVVTGGSTPEVILDRAQDLQQKSGQDIGNILKQFDSKMNDDSNLTSKFFNPGKTADQIQTQLLEPLKINGQISPVAKGAANTVQDILDTINQYGEKPIPFEKAQELKTMISNLANYEADGSTGNQLLKQAAGIINQNIEQSADNVAKASGLTDLSDRYLKAKDLYKTAKTTVDAATNKVAGNMANNTVGLTDYMAAGAGALAHGLPTGLVAGAANKVAKTYGNSLIAQGANGMSKVLSGMNKILVDAPKESLVNMGKQFVASGDPLKTSLGNVLVKAAERDDVGRNALIFSLMQNPAYREVLRSHMGLKDPLEEENK